ncbi:hypothetical protein JEQ12_011969 [Ovis aries]|uniref:Uncharacterized protein n=1 Tax=Ovis aries TaxID=9940 RepID=A0A835ZNE1_SHEEP|nr:hypothetical protein JEQ12_011969 [Ovis aries]
MDVSFSAMLLVHHEECHRRDGLKLKRLFSLDDFCYLDGILVVSASAGPYLSSRLDAGKLFLVILHYVNSQSPQSSILFLVDLFLRTNTKLHDFAVSPFLFSDPSFCSVAPQAPG